LANWANFRSASGSRAKNSTASNRLRRAAARESGTSPLGGRFVVKNATKGQRCPAHGSAAWAHRFGSDCRRNLVIFVVVRTLMPDRSLTDQRQPSGMPK
jgi:hypothetical protein